MRLNYTERTLFLIRDHQCDIENIHLYFPARFLGGSWVFSGSFMGVSRALQDYFKSVPRVFAGYF